jgi:scaffold protein (connect acetoacetyl-CoA thiolase and HMG-CoA synthase)
MPAPQYAREIPQRYRLEAGRCTGCSKIAFPPRRVCPSCHGDSFETITLSGEGKLVTWTVIHVAPGDFAVQAPYVVGIVELDEGVRLTAQIVDCNVEELDFGTPVRRVLRRLRAEGEGGIIQYGYKFVPAIT